MNQETTAGVILCGGQSRRMGGVVKAQQLLAGRPLLQHVMGRLAPQVNRMVLSVESVSPRFTDYGLEQIADPQPGHGGPLGGLLSGLRAVAEHHEWLLLVPCDAPFFPLDLEQRLRDWAVKKGAGACLVSYRGSVQPTFSIWNRCLLTSLEQAVLEGEMSGFKQYIKHNPQPLVEWENADISPFFNINDSAALAEAERLIGSQRT